MNEDTPVDKLDAHELLVKFTACVVLLEQLQGRLKYLRSERDKLFDVELDGEEVEVKRDKLDSCIAEVKEDIDITMDMVLLFKKELQWRMRNKVIMSFLTVCAIITALWYLTN